MKKALAAIVSSLIIVALCVCFAACSTGSGDFEGVWRFQKVSVQIVDKVEKRDNKGNTLVIDGEIQYQEVTSTCTYESKAGEQYYGISYSENFAVLDIFANNTFAFKVYDKSASGHLEENGGKYYLTVKGDAIKSNYSVDLPIDLNGRVLSLKEGDSFEVIKEGNSLSFTHIREEVYENNVSYSVSFEFIRR